MTIINARAAGFALLLAGLAPVLAGCNEPKDAVAAAPAAPETEVSVVTVKQQARAIVRELPGRIAPTRVADVRSRVSGIIIERAFHQGTEVKAGDTLYRIDPKPFEVELQAAKASLQKAEAAYDTATLQAKRLSGLAQQKAVSEAEGERSTVSSVRHWSPKARWWRRTTPPISPPSNSSIRSMPTSPSRCRN